MTVLQGNGNGTFNAAQNFAGGSNLLSIALTDVNGDGNLDVVGADATTVKVVVLPVT